MLKIKTIVISVLFLFILFSDAKSGSIYYVSAGNGSDTNKGSLANPFKTIQKAADIMKAGDICYIRQGVYRELVTVGNSGKADEPISFSAYQGETPVVSGADILNLKWSVYRGSIYKASTPWQFNQLFVDEDMINEARWPNVAVNELVTMPRAICDSNTNVSTLVDDNLPAGDWNGGYVSIAPGSAWTSFARKITDYKPGISFKFDNSQWPSPPYYTPKQGNRYWLFGRLDGLDIPTEWFLDKSTNTIYIWCPGDPDPAKHSIAAKKRNYGFDVKGQQHIQIKGLRFFGTSPVNTENASNCLIEHCHVKYIEHYNIYTSGFDNSNFTNKILGSNITFRNCSIAYSAGNGLYDGGNNNKIINCIIHDICYMGGYTAAINAPGSAGEYRQNTLYNSGRYIFLHAGKQFKFLNNDLFNGGILTDDIGLTYTYGTDGQGSVIAYNKVHDNKAKTGIGIYLDNYTKNYVVHHNLVWNMNNSAIRLNTPSHNHLVYNNTALTNCKNAFNYYAQPGETPDQKGTKVVNNLFKCPPGRFVTGDLAPQAHHNGDYPIDANNWPSAGSGAIDAGVVIKGITDGYVGSAPDIGCFEVGSKGWTAGADWTEIPW